MKQIQHKRGKGEPFSFSPEFFDLKLCLRIQSVDMEPLVRTLMPLFAFFFLFLGVFEGVCICRVASQNLSEEEADAGFIDSFNRHRYLIKLASSI